MINYKPHYKITNSYWIAANYSHIKTELSIGDIIYLTDTKEVYCQTPSGLSKIGKQEVLSKQECTYIKPLICSCCGASISPNFAKCEYCGVYYK